LPACRVAPSVPATTAASAARQAGFYAATRAGKKKVTAALDPTVHKQLKTLAVAQDTTTEALLLEAIADLFVKHGQKTSGR
jgi:uroporphyrinogen-III synthase